MFIGFQGSIKVCTWIILYGDSPDSLLVIQVTATPPFATPSRCNKDKHVTALAPLPITNVCLKIFTIGTFSETLEVFND